MLRCHQTVPHWPLHSKMVMFAFTKSIFTSMKMNHDSCINGRHMIRDQSLVCTFWTITPNRLLGELKLNFIFVFQIEKKFSVYSQLFHFQLNSLFLSPQLEHHCGNMRSLPATTIPNTRFGVVHHGNVCKRYDLRRRMGSQCFSKPKSIPLHRISC